MENLNKLEKQNMKLLYEKKEKKYFSNVLTQGDFKHQTILRGKKKMDVALLLSVMQMQF